MYLDLDIEIFVPETTNILENAKKVLLFLHIFNALDETDGNGPDGC